MVTTYRPNGASDESFAGDGVLDLRPRAKGEVPIELIAVKALRGGRILAAGTLNGRVMLVALRPNGKPDCGFGGGDGLDFTDADRRRRCACGYATDMEVDGRGRIVIAANVTRPPDREPAALIRYRPNGKLDRGFGKGGIARAALGARLASKVIAIQEDNHIVLAGTYNVPQSGEARLAVARFLPSGRLDRTFARRGFFVHDFGYEAAAYAALTQRDGKVVIAGRANATRPESPDSLPPTVYDNARVFLTRFLP